MCSTSLAKAVKPYYYRNSICESCSKQSSCTVDGVPKRWCQQCCRFQDIADFDDERRTCKWRLELHNRRRKRKPALDANAIGSSPGGDGSNIYNLNSTDAVALTASGRPQRDAARHHRYPDGKIDESQYDDDPAEEDLVQYKKTWKSNKRSKATAVKQQPYRNEYSATDTNGFGPYYADPMRDASAGFTGQQYNNNGYYGNYYNSVDNRTTDSFSGGGQNPILATTTGSTRPPAEAMYRNNQGGFVNFHQPAEQLLGSLLRSAAAAANTFPQGFQQGQQHQNINTMLYQTATPNFQNGVDVLNPAVATTLLDALLRSRATNNTSINPMYSAAYPPSTGSIQQQQYVTPDVPPISQMNFFPGPLLGAFFAPYAKPGNDASAKTIGEDNIAAIHDYFLQQQQQQNNTTQQALNLPDSKDGGSKQPKDDAFR